MPSVTLPATFVGKIACPGKVISPAISCFLFPVARESSILDDWDLPRHAASASQGDPMNSPKIVVSLGFMLILSVILTACGGSKSTPPPPGPPTIQTLTLPQGAVNTPYFNGIGATLSATGGTGAYTWSIASGSLPPGLTLNAS